LGSEYAISKALSHSGEQNSLELKYETLEPLLTMQHQTKEDFIRGENHALIAVTSASEASITLDLEEAAHSMIVRACHNHDLLGLPPTSKTCRFEDLFYEDVIGV
jgi:hypothetical protein